MATAAMTVNAPSNATRVGFWAALKARISGAYYGVRRWLGEVAERTGFNRAVGFARRVLRKGWGYASAVVRAAGIIPLSLLAVTSRTGQKIIKAVAVKAYRFGSWLYNKAVGALDWTLRLFGSPGKKAADWAAKTRASVNGWFVRNITKVAAVVGPYLSPERIYMRVTKVGAYLATGAGLITTYLSGVWLVPAFLLLVGAGLVMSPTVRNSSFMKRITGSTEDVAKDEAKRVVIETMDQMVAEYGPNMNSWSTAAKTDYAIKEAIIKHLNGDKNWAKGLSNTSRKRAEQWIRDFEASVEEIVENAKAATGEKPMTVSAEDGHVVVGDAATAAASS